MRNSEPLNVFKQYEYCFDDLLIELYYLACLMVCFICTYIVRFKDVYVILVVRRLPCQQTLFTRYSIEVNYPLEEGYVINHVCPVVRVSVYLFVRSQAISKNVNEF